MLGICVCLGGFLSAFAIAHVAWAATGQCCGTVNKISQCSGCIYYTSGGTSGCMNIGDHGGKKCKSGTAEQDCDEESRVCTTIPVGTTVYSCVYPIPTCIVSKGITTVAINLSVDQCGGDDSGC